MQAEPHNLYVTFLLRGGVFPALLAMQVVWFIAWMPGMEQGIITGLAAGLAASSRRGVGFLQTRPVQFATRSRV